MGTVNLETAQREELKNTQQNNTHHQYSRTRTHLHTMVNLLFSTFAVVTGVASGFPSSDLFSCGQDTNGLDRKPGDFWMEDCNACICQNDNVKSCTRKLCGTDQFFCEDSNRQVKKEGETWMQDGDECTCTGGNTECKSPALIEDDQSCGVDANGQARNPGDVWTEDCNTCSCLPIGVKRCSRRLCPQTTTPPAFIDPRLESCGGRNPGDEWMENCNKCSCLSSGVKRCTKNLCGPSGPPPGFDCGGRNPGDQWMEDCNTCSCMVSGIKRCSSKLCPDASCKDESGAERTEGETWSQSNNSEQCVCNEGNVFCRPLLAEVSSPAPVDRTCGGREQGASWMEDCNTCSCLANDVKRCSKKLCGCVDSLGNKRTEGESWEQEDSSCSCSGGVVGCTPLTAPFPFDPREKIREKGCGVDENGRERQPGDSWKDDCNTCKCLTSGTPRCTRQFCGVNFG